MGTRAHVSCLPVELKMCVYDTYLLPQMTSFLILFLVGGQIETQLLSTGAFEVYLNGKCSSFLESLRAFRVNIDAGQTALQPACMNMVSLTVCKTIFVT